MDRSSRRIETRPAAASAPSGAGWYVMVQGPNIAIEHHSGVPSTQHEPGQKMIRATGPFADEATARKVSDQMQGKVDRKPRRVRGSK